MGLTGEVYNKICAILDWSANGFKDNPSNGLTDENIHWEKIAMRIFNVVRGWDLFNMNSRQQNYPGIDLCDKNRRVGIQVTSKKTSPKMNDTLTRIQDNNVYNVISTLYVFVLGSKQTSYSINFSLCPNVHFSEDNIWDFSTLKEEILNVDAEKQQEVLEILEWELGTADKRLAGRLTSYYDNEIRLFEKKGNRESIVGDESLAESYITPYAYDINEKKPILQIIENWFENTQSGVMLLYGEPGDGKTSLCRNAIYAHRRGDYFRNCWDVLWFPLNQHESRIVDGDRLNIENAFHPKYEYDNKIISLREGKHRLIFLDGYDEIKLFLQSSKACDSLKDFLDRLKYFAECYDIHFVVTSRYNAIKYDLDLLSDEIVVKSFLPLSYEDQNKWIHTSSRNQRYKDYWEKYLKDICVEKKSGEAYSAMYDLLQIPFVFRMVVNQEYRLSDTTKNQAKLYEDLFVQTLDRSRNVHSEDYKDKYMSLAFDIWKNDEDTVIVREPLLKDDLLFSYYLKEDIENEAEIGFIHRSIYQYFVAEYLYNKLILISNSEEANLYAKNTAYRYIDNDIIQFLLQIAGNRNNKIAAKNCIGLLNQVSKTEAIFVFNQADCYGTNESGYYNRCNNIYSNIINICSCFDIEWTKVEDNSFFQLLGRYKCPGIKLRGATDNAVMLVGLDWKLADFQNVSFENAFIGNTSIELSDFSGGTWDHVRCESVDIGENKCYGTAFKGINLHSCPITNNRYHEVHFADINIDDCKLYDNTIRFSMFNNITISGSEISNTSLSRCELNDIKIEGSITNIRFVKGTINNTQFLSNFMGRTTIQSTSIINTKFVNYDFEKTSLHNVELEGVIFENVKFDGLGIYNSIFKTTEFRNVDIEGLRTDIKTLRTMPWNQIEIKTIYIKNQKYKPCQLRALLVKEQIIDA